MGFHKMISQFTLVPLARIGLGPEGMAAIPDLCSMPTFVWLLISILSQIVALESVKVVLSLVKVSVVAFCLIALFNVYLQKVD